MYKLWMNFFLLYLGSAAGKRPYTETVVTAVNGKGCAFKTYEGGDTKLYLTYTMDGNAQGAHCNFPFIVDGNVKTECEPYDNYTWCSTISSYNSSSSENRWGKCIKDSVPTVEGNGTSRPCYFPFKYNGDFHYKCLPKDDYEWCSTTADYEADKKWGKCVQNKGPSTIGGNAQGAPCKFPFTFEGKQHFNCINHGSSYKWCAITDNFDQDQLWGKCLEQDDVERLPTIYAAVPSSAVIEALGGSAKEIVNNIPSEAVGLLGVVAGVGASFPPVAPFFILLGAGLGTFNALNGVSPDKIIGSVNKAFDMLRNEIDRRMGQVQNYVDKKIRDLLGRIVKSRYKVDQDRLARIALKNNTKHALQQLENHVDLMFSHRLVYMDVDKVSTRLEDDDVKTLEVLLPLLKQHVDLHLLASAALINLTRVEGDKELMERNRVMRNNFIEYVNEYVSYIEWAYGQILGRRVKDQRFVGDKNYTCEEARVYNSSRPFVLNIKMEYLSTSERECHFKCTSMERDFDCSVDITHRCTSSDCAFAKTPTPLEDQERKTRHTVNRICNSYLDKLEKHLKNFWHREVLDYIPVWQKAADLQQDELDKMKRNEKIKTTSRNAIRNKNASRKEIKNADIKDTENIQKLEKDMRKSLSPNLTMFEYANQALKNAAKIKRRNDRHLG